MMPRTAAVVVLAAFSVLFWFSTSQPPAIASCASESIESPAAFTGVVTSTTSQGRVATVRTETGETVRVNGTPALGSTQTSVDRTYEVGGRYEFHPINSSSPFEDNACTATHLLSMTSIPATPFNDTSPGWVAATAVIAGAVAVGLAVFRRRSRRRQA